MQTDPTKRLGTGTGTDTYIYIYTHTNTGNQEPMESILAKM